MTRENLPAGWHIQGEQPAASDGDGGRSYAAALEHQARRDYVPSIGDRVMCQFRDLTRNTLEIEGTLAQISSTYIALETADGRRVISKQALRNIRRSP